MKDHRGIYQATPITVEFPKDFIDPKLAGKTVTYSGRGRHPNWYDIAVEYKLIKTDDKEEDKKEIEKEIKKEDAVFYDI